MASIDEVIARSRQPGGFTEKKRFSVARQRAIRKMREFALADPHYYVLELIQAAVANSAENVDIRAEKREFGLSYIGGGYTQEELAQLFDFLFASKRDFEHGDLRQLALGVNALMIFEPESIIIESGDGTLASTTRIEIRGRDETVDVGTPDQALRGTFIRAAGLNRSAVRGKSNLDGTDYGPAETRAIEERCLAAPVPIIVNTEPVFGYSTVRTPNIFGYDNVVSFDEGDLYGSIGRAVHAHKRFFKVMTWGVWISSLEHDLLENTQMGGVVNYDHLNKTADHSGIVQDDRLQEFWARLLPYARRSQRGESGKAVFQIRPLGGEDLRPKALRDMVRDAQRAVVTPADLEPGSDRALLASEIGDALGAPVLCVADGEFEALQNIAGPSVRLIRPSLDDHDELAFFRQSSVEAPPRPWLCGVTEVEGLDVSEISEALVAEEYADSEVAVETFVNRVLGDSGTINCRIYTPERAEFAGGGGVWARVMTMERLVWEGAIPSSFPGHVMDVEVPAVSPLGLTKGLPGNRKITVAEAVAEIVARHVMANLEETASRAVTSLSQASVEPGSVAARIALAAISRDALLRLREPSPDETTPTLYMSMIEQSSELDLLELPLLETVGGEPVSVSELPMIMSRQHGLLYGVVPEVEPDLQGLDDRRVLSLDSESERLVSQIVGQAAYVRIDERDLLASADGITVRDVAAGLREQAEVPILLESNTPLRAGELPEETIVALVSELTRVALSRAQDSENTSLLRLQRLTADVLDLDPQATPPRGALQHCRQGLLHLQYFILSRWKTNRTAEGEPKPLYGLERLPVFVGDRGGLVSLRDLEAALDEHGSLLMLDGRALDPFSVGEDVGGVVADQTDEVRECSGLSMNPWLLHLLGGAVDMEPAFDFDLTDEEASAYRKTPDEAYLFASDIEAPGITGRVGVAADSSADLMIAVLEPGHGQVHPLRGPSERYRVVGFARVENSRGRDRWSWWSDVVAAVNQAARSVLVDIVDALPKTDTESPEYHRMLQVLFEFASRHVRFERQAGGRVVSRVDHPVAELILELPLFGTARGTPVSAQRLIHEFCLEETKGAPIRKAGVIADTVPPILKDWRENFLTVDRILERPGASASRVPDRAPDAQTSLDQMSKTQLTALLEQWLDALRNDDDFSRIDTSNEEGVRAPGIQIMVVDATQDDEIEKLPTPAARHLGRTLDGEHPFAYTVSPSQLLLIDANHWIWKEFKVGSQPRAQRIAWMLLSIYAFINEVREPVRNEHELAFQRRIAEAIQAGTFESEVART